MKKYVFTLVLYLLTILFVLAQPAPGGCLASVDEASRMFSNPTEINGIFSFDYKISSRIEGYWADDETSNPTLHEFYLQYYVNTNDGSLYMSEGDVNIMLATLGVEFRDILYNSLGKIEGVIRLANGQLVIYVLDRKNLLKRAITIENASLPFNVYKAQGERLNSFIDDVILTNNIERGGRTSEASDLIMRADLWGGQGGLTQVNEVWEQPQDDLSYLVTMQIANDPGIDAIATDIPLVGFLTGIMKSKRSPCNYLVVETLIEEVWENSSTANPNGSNVSLNSGGVVDAYISETMTSFTKSPRTVDTNEYEKMTLEGGFNLSAYDREQILDSQVEYYAKLGRLLKQLENCRDDEFCIAHVNQDILRLQKEYENQAYKAANTADITDVQLEEHTIKDRMYTVHGQIIEQEKKCKSLNDQTARCGGCMDRPYEDCLKKLQEMYDFLDDLQCQLAKLKGMQDLMEDCH